MYVCQNFLNVKTIMIVIDTETTGIDPVKNSLLSIGAIDFNDPTRRFYGECRIFDEALISREALTINGFTEESIRDVSKMSDKELLLKFVEWANGSSDTTFAGENPSFDRDFMRQTALRYGLDWKFAHRTVDLHSVAYAYIRGRGMTLPMKNGHTGQDLAATLRLVGMSDTRKAHNALEDALLEAEAFYRRKRCSLYPMHHSIYRLPPEKRAEKFESDQRGRLREQAFLHAWRDVSVWPKWMIRAPTKASKTDDIYRGIDAYIHTDIGDLPVQVKGSTMQMHRYLQGGHQGITVVVVNEVDTPETIRGYTHEHLKKGYEIAKNRLLKAQRCFRRDGLAKT
jgi:DNA polymerase III epsilon subunit-like protein